MSIYLFSQQGELPVRNYMWIHSLSLPVQILYKNENLDET